MKNSEPSLKEDFDYEFEMNISTESSQYKETLLAVDICYYDYMDDGEGNYLKFILAVLNGYIINEDNLGDLLDSADSISSDILYKVHHFSNKVAGDDYYGSIFILEEFTLKKEMLSFKEKVECFKNILVSLDLRLEAFGVKFFVFCVEDFSATLKKDEKLYFVDQVMAVGFIPIWEESGGIVIMKDLRYL